MVSFGIWLLKKGNRESTVERKLKYLKRLSLNNLEAAKLQVLSSPWSDRSKKQALIALKQYAEFKGVRLSLPNFRVYVKFFLNDLEVLLVSLNRSALLYVFTKF